METTPAQDTPMQKLHKWVEAHTLYVCNEELPSNHVVDLYLLRAEINSLLKEEAILIKGAYYAGYESAEFVNRPIKNQKKTSTEFFNENFNP